MRVAVFAILLLAAGSAAQAANLSALDDSALPGRNRYDRCLELTHRNAQQALELARVWQSDRGGPAATHCAALAMVALKRYPEAARQLDQMGHANIGGAVERATLFDQAGNAWLLAHRGGEATISFSSALALSPHDPDLLADRARAAALLGDWKAADIDLSSALKLDASRADLLVLRASARHAIGRTGDARTDLEAALHILPGYPEALLELGTLKLESGDSKGARADWQRVVSEAPTSDAAAIAQQRLTAFQPSKAK
ncbi:MAG TPA: tetratricopeptide repeat protein [Rhizomicrobium sp.]|jgi:tetratricopeptide (TPR) repeat protein|nr:tetratricopeptide repeat protein [Rhizomicrobium sp.]